ARTCPWNPFKWSSSYPRRVPDEEPPVVRGGTSSRASPGISPGWSARTRLCDVGYSTGPHTLTPSRGTEGPQVTRVTSRDGSGDIRRRTRVGMTRDRPAGRSLVMSQSAVSRGSLRGERRLLVVVDGEDLGQAGDPEDLQQP